MKFSMIFKFTETQISFWIKYSIAHKVSGGLPINCFGEGFLNGLKSIDGNCLITSGIVEKCLKFLEVLRNADIPRVMN